MVYNHTLLSYHLVSQDEVDDFRCECALGYNGTICERNINDCAPNPCVHGQCMVISVLMCTLCIYMCGLKKLLYVSL